MQIKPDCVSYLVGHTSKFSHSSSNLFIMHRAIWGRELGHTETHTNTVEPLSNDHPHHRPSLLYDQISCDGQCFLFVRSLTDDLPSNATNDRVRWSFLPRGRPLRGGPYSVFPRIAGGASTSVPNGGLLHCFTQTHLK